MRSSAFCLPPASSGLVQLPACCLGFGLLEMLVCVCLILRIEMPFYVSFIVVCGQRTVAACCEKKTGLEWGSLMNVGSRCTRNAVAPPCGTLDSEARISGPKSSHESGPCASHHTVRYRARGPRSGPETGPKIRSPKSGRPAAQPAGIKCGPRE